jgi:hypothetical protein
LPFDLFQRRFNLGKIDAQLAHQFAAANRNLVALDHSGDATPDPRLDALGRRASLSPEMIVPSIGKRSPGLMTTRSPA